VDKIYHSTPDEGIIINFPTSQIHLIKSNLPDTTLWNLGPGGTMEGMEDGGCDKVAES
jgi:hypothetical protein